MLTDERRQRHQKHVERVDEERNGELIQGCGNALPAVGPWSRGAGEVDHSTKSIFHLHFQDATQPLRLFEIEGEAPVGPLPKVRGERPFVRVGVNETEAGKCAWVRPV